MIKEKLHLSNTKPPAQFVNISESLSDTVGMGKFSSILQASSEDQHT